MKTERLNLTKKYILGMLILLTGMMAFNRALYTHVHVLPDGTVQTHAHPFSKNGEGAGGETHHHTMMQFVLLHSLNLLIAMSAATFLFMCSGGSESAPTFPRSAYNREPVRLRPGRAPPAAR